jgi:hypothetical protein
MTMRFACCSLAVALLMAVCGSAAADGVPASSAFFTAFKTFCIDTGAKPEAVESAVLAAGGKRAALQYDIVPAINMPVKPWDVSLGGEHFVVYAGRNGEAGSKDSPATTEGCGVRSAANEDAGIAAIRQWGGNLVADGRFASLLFGFADMDSVRKPAADLDPVSWKAAQAGGRGRMLATRHLPNGADAELYRILPAGH